MGIKKEEGTERKENGAILAVHRRPEARSNNCRTGKRACLLKRRFDVLFYFSFKLVLDGEWLAVL